jgi:molybdopterin synthase catalytic subunit
MASSQDEVWEVAEDVCHVGLTKEHLNVQTVMDKVRSPQAGAIVLFAGKPL